MPLVLTRSDVSRERETRSQNYTRTYSFDDATTQKMRRIFAKGRFQKKNFRKLLQRDGIDARSVQKTSAVVSLIRRGLFFVKRQRRYAVYLQKTSRPEKVDSSDTQGKSAFDYRFQIVR